jgi:hypothetical protein
VPGDWNFKAALELADQRMRDAGIAPEAIEPAEPSYVGRARRQAEVMAPVLMRLQRALLLGTSPEELDRVRGGARILLEGIKATLGIVGLRAGEEVSVDMSERMQSFLDRWQERRMGPAAPSVIDQDPGEPARRVPIAGSES